jgi:single-strand DNA-binding protein
MGKQHGINTIVMAGNVAFEPRVFASQGSGSSWGVFKIRVTENFNGRDWQSTWGVKVFGRNCEVVNSLHAGDYVLIQGRLQTSKYKNKEGVDVDSVEIVANYIASVMRTGGIGDTDATGFPPDDGTTF